MKTPAKWWADLQHGDNVIADIVARDAEHRAELLKLQDDLLAGANREVMATALIERLRGELGEAEAALTVSREAVQAYCDGENAMRGKLDRAVGYLRKMPPILGHGALCICGLCAYLRELAAPLPPAPSCTASVGSCNSPNACGEAGRCIDARMREFVGPAESTPVLCEQHGREDCPRPDHAAPHDDIRERLEGRLRWHDQQFAALERRLAALEAKGEPGTLMHVDREALHRYLPCTDDGETWRCFVCGNPDDSSLHPKGAKP